MKKIILLITLSIVLLSCSKNGGGSYTITGIANGIADGSKVIIQKQSEDGNSNIGVDTVLVKAGKFEIKGKVDETTIHGITVESTRGMISVIVEKGDIKVEVDKDSVFKSKVSGTYNNEQFQKFYSGISKIQKSVQDRKTKFQLDNKLIVEQAKKTNDTATISKLRKEYGKIQNDLANYSLNFIKENPKAYISLLLVQGLFNNPEFELKDVKVKFDSLDSSLKQLKPAKKIQEIFDTVSATEIGKEAPGFKAKDTRGNEVSLSESLGDKVTIVDFWASWCMPCRQENPNMVALYKEFHAKGLNIVGVSLDRDSKEWITAIAKDQLTWTHVSNLKQWEDPIAKQYNVNQIPATFILDKDGKIVAKDLKGAELRKKVAELINK